MGQAKSAMADHLPITASTFSSLANGAAVNLFTEKPEGQHKHIWLITGPAGSGKSTVAQYIAKSMDLPYIEGDEVCRRPHFVLQLFLSRLHRC